MSESSKREEETLDANSKKSTTHRPPPPSGAPLALSEWKPPPPRPLNAGWPAPPPPPRPPRPPPPPPIGGETGGKKRREKREEEEGQEKKKNSKKIDLCRLHSLAFFEKKGERRQEHLLSPALCFVGCCSKLETDGLEKGPTLAACSERQQQGGRERDGGHLIGCSTPTTTKIRRRQTKKETKGRRRSLFSV